MKVVAVREAKEQLSDYIEKSQEERVLITRRGKPAAVVIGVEGRDFEDILLMQTPRFWKMIEARRAEPTFSIAEARRRLGLRKLRRVATRKKRR